jgi:nicotinate phosphoribosyltransferase
LRTERVLAGEGRNPLVTMEVFCRRAGATLCGIDEAKGLLSLALEADAAAGRATVWALKDGDEIAAKEVVLRIRAPYQSIVRLETAYLGMMAHGTGWATAARAIVDAAAPTPVIAFGARHVHPNVADRLDYAAIIGGATGASTTAGSARAGRLPVGTMPHALVLIYGVDVSADGHVAVTMTLTTPHCPVAESMPGEVELRVGAVPGIGDAEVNLVWEPAWSPANMTDEARLELGML